MFDLVIAALALVVLFPVFLLVALLIVLDSPGPVFYRAERTGFRAGLCACSSSARCARTPGGSLSP